MLTVGLVMFLEGIIMRAKFKTECSLVMNAGDVCLARTNQEYTEIK